MGEAHSQPLAPRAAAIASGHLGGRPGLVDEDRALGIEIELTVEAALALLQDIGRSCSIAYRSSLRVIPCRAKKRCTVPPTGAPRLVERASISTRVMPPCSASSCLMKSPCASILPEWRSPPRRLATGRPRASSAGSSPPRAIACVFQKFWTPISLNRGQAFR
jgi:hypothetical protein